MDGKSKINWEKVDKECYSEMVNQALTNRKVMEEAQKLESNYGIENMIVEISNIFNSIVGFKFLCFFQLWNQMTFIYKLFNVVCSIVITVFSKIFIYVSSY
jgi:hypothetical protein